MRAVSILTLALLAASPAAAADLFHGLSPAERQVADQVLEIVRAECPALQFIDLDRNGPGTPISLAQVSVQRIDDPFWSDNKLFKNLGWKTAFIGIGIDVKNGPYYSLMAGGGATPAIVSRYSGGYAGTKECGLDQGQGEYRYRKVKALKVIDQIK